MLAEQAPGQTRADRIVRGVARRWAGLLTGLLLVFAGLPWLSPLLRSLGFERAGRAIFVLYTRFCHQLPERSFFFGGYQVCYCHRCTALYTTLLGLSLLYTVGRWRWTIGPRALLVLTLPMVVDGLWHMAGDIVPGLRSADSSVGSPNFWLRMVTGTLFAVGAVLWSYPRIQREAAKF